MWYFFPASPGTWLLIGIILIICLIFFGIKSAGNILPQADPDFDDKYKEVMKNMGPMTWKERVVSVILLVAFVALVLWVSSML